MKIKNLLMLVSVSILFLFFTGCNREQLDALQLSQSQLKLRVGESYQLEVIHQPIEATPTNKVSWKSSDSNVATVDSKGVITAVYSGSCTITAYSGEVEAKCFVVVENVVYDLQFSKAIAYVYGDDAQIGANHLTLRLLEEGMFINSQEEVEGNGYFLNIDLYLPFSADTLLPGVYTSFQQSTLNSFLQGTLVESDGEYYATGTYLGHYSDNGLSALFIVSGQVDVKTDGQFRILVNLTGEKKEELFASFGGAIDFVDKTESNPSTLMTFDVDTALFFNDANRDSVNLNVTRIQLLNVAGDTLQLAAYVPLSITDTLPEGTYVLSEYAAQPFKLIPDDEHHSDGCWLSDKSGRTALLNGSFVFWRDASRHLKYRFAFNDADHRIIQSATPSKQTLRITKR